MASPMLQLLPDWEHLAAAPARISELNTLERAELIVSAAVGEDGSEVVISRLKDSVWELGIFLNSPGNCESERRLCWPSDCPPLLLEDMKAAAYAWKREGRSGTIPPQWNTVRATCIKGFPFVRWLTQQGVTRFEDVHAIHVANYKHHCKAELNIDAGAIRARFVLIDVLWIFRNSQTHPMKTKPWKERGMNGIARLSFETAKTPIIPPDVQAKVYRFCCQTIDAAGPVLKRIESGALGLWEAEALMVRDAAMYVVLITTGMRTDELLRIERGAFREEWVDGHVYRWVRTTEHKTKKGLVDYLCPAVTGKALSTLERYVSPLTSRLAAQISHLQSSPLSAKSALRLSKAEADRDRIFLNSVRQSNAADRAMTVVGCRIALSRIRYAAGVDWVLSSHQTRRTFARMVVESRMGRSSLIFLKWQLKHSSMTMSQGYASNPAADRSLFEDFIAESTDLKSNLLEGWLAETPLSGGAGRAIMKLRATPHKSRASMLKSAAEQVHVRATGHSWCLAQESGCGGAGLYEATLCVDCKSGVIDESFASIWQEIHNQQRELLDVKDAGPAVTARAQREVRLSAKVLADLGVVVQRSA